jgi:5-methylcytosine-specific restriction endonuclease McrA
MKRTRLNPISKKKRKALAQRNKTYEQIDQSREHVCSGCGRRDVPLSHSHIIPISRRPDLEADPDNIVYDCLSIGGREGCHEKCEGRNIRKMSELMDFSKRIEYIKSIDLIYYQLVILKFDNTKSIVK